ncbi:MAG: hydroxymethylbilane synthase [Actinomycetaceae bacterium]|nr:hydroxymethylbilane synthase [Actinomycetaceae bacterium]
MTNSAAPLGSPENPVRIGTRASLLATTQTATVTRFLEEAGLATQTIHITTEGDTARASLSTLGGVGVFAARLRAALLDGECDVAVHSAKDLPAGDVEGLAIGAYPLRERTADVLVSADGSTLASLPAGARIGTGSPRRAAQILAARPDLEMVDIRGNVTTRLGRVRGRGFEGAGDLDGVILAYAGLARLGLAEYVTEVLDNVLIPAGAQGALAVEVRAGDLSNEQGARLTEALRRLDHGPTRLAVEAERAFLRALEAGCSAPIGVRGRIDGDVLHLDGRVVSLDGSRIVQHSTDTVLSLDEGPSSAAAVQQAQRAGEDLGLYLIEHGARDITALSASKNTDEKTLWGEAQ